MYGFSVYPRRHVTEPEIVEAYRGIPVANISDVMARTNGGGALLRPMHDGTPMAGPALTVKTRPGDNLMLHKALQIAEPGDVIVVEAGGDLTNSLFGGNMLAYAAYRRLGGIVISGAIRDLAEIREQSLPVFAMGVTHRGPYKDGPGEVNCPIALNGMAVEPGDLIVGDLDGVLAIPREQAGLLLAAARAKRDWEIQTGEAGRAGHFEKAWIDKELAAKGCLGLR
ncbi:RraA family protein [Ensifer sp. YR511]|uniref:RraA family protein n=1 Tax=Ensifer sp. YR511 TaxID=1855294 RepID=UPI00088CDFB0|nr:RraA family protein [Ensifer sp. YR511]SDO17023.1 Regulator of RNase E activity RraA [Ensifer sp. YR511]